MATALLFEHKTCPRCGGSGTYSYCSAHGNRCFGCGGKGNVLTKRGRAAQLFYNELKTKPVEEFKVGDSYLLEGFSAGSYAQPSRWYAVTNISADPRWPEQLLLEGAAKNGETCCYHASLGSRVRYSRTAEEVKAHKELALAYQATLTKMGKPMKRRAA